MAKKFKLKKVHKQGIAGIGFGIIGLYMILVLNNIQGLIPIVIGISILLWRMKQ